MTEDQKNRRREAEIEYRKALEAAWFPQYPDTEVWRKRILTPRSAAPRSREAKMIECLLEPVGCDAVTATLYCDCGHSFELAVLDCVTTTGAFYLSDLICPKCKRVGHITTDPTHRDKDMFEDGDGG